MNHIYSGILILLLSCQGKESNILDGQNAASLNAQENSLTRTSLPEDRETLFDQDLEFEILESKRSINHQSSAPDTLMCSGWTLDANEIKRIIKGIEPLDAHVWHHAYDVYPCIVDGQLKQGNIKYNFSINAGSYLTISNKDTTLLFGDEEKKFEKVFLSSRWTEEDDKK
jgi:hypothetical protein